MRGSADDVDCRRQVQKTLSGRLRLAREACELSQEDVAERIGVASEVYGKMERGHIIPRVRTLVKLSAALGVSVDRLLGLDDGSGVAPVIRPKEKDLPAEARPVLRSMRELTPADLKILTTTGFALLEAKEERRKRRAARGR